MRDRFGRSAAVLALLGLAACDRPAPAPQPSATAGPVPAASPSAVPTPAPAPTPTATPTPSPTPSPSATPTPTPKPAPDKHLQALGTEPFWSIDVLPKGRLKYSTPDMLNGVMVSAIEKRTGETIRFTARLNGRPFILTVVPGKCSDGMSDVVYPYTVTFLHSGRTDHGCARMK